MGDNLRNVTLHILPSTRWGHGETWKVIDPPLHATSFTVTWSPWIIGFLDSGFGGFDAPAEVQHCAFKGHSARKQREALSASRHQRNDQNHIKPHQPPKVGAILNSTTLFIGFWIRNHPSLCCYQGAKGKFWAKTWPGKTPEKTHSICEAASKRSTPLKWVSWWWICIGNTVGNCM